MYIIRKQLPHGLAFLTYGGWDVFTNTPLELDDAIRFTKREKEMIILPNGEEFVHFGCYKELK